MQSRSTLCSVVLFVALSASLVRAQPKNLEFERLTTLDGLSQDIVSFLHRDQFGFLWIGTEDGLNVYDGYSLKIYRHTPGDSTTLPSSWIVGICDYGDEDLLISTQRGIAVYRRAEDAFHPPGSAFASFGDAGLGAPTRDSSGNFWMRLESTKILKCSADLRHVEQFDVRSLNDAITLHSLVTDSRGRVLAGSDGCLVVFDAGRAAPVLIPVRDSTLRKGESVNVISVLEKGDGGFWLGTNNGLYLFSERDHLLRNYSLDRSEERVASVRDYIFDMKYDREGRIWVAGFGGLYCFDPGSESSLSYRNLQSSAAGPNPPRLYALCVDPAGILWVGSWRGGLWKGNLRHLQFGLLRHGARTPFAGGSSEVTSIYEDPGGRLWFGGAGLGVTLLDPASGAFRAIVPSTGGHSVLSGGVVSAMAGDSLGNVWIASAQNVVDWYDLRSGESRHLRLPSNPGESVSILSMLYDGAKEYLWIGTEAAGVYRLDVRRGVFERFGPASADSRTHAIHSAWAFHRDHAGNIWIGGWTFNTQLHRIDGATGDVRSYAQPSLLSARAILEAPDGMVWVGTWGNGLTRLDPATGAMRNYGDHEGLPSNYIKGMLRDRRGALWLSTERGLSVFTPSSETFRNYDVSDGLQGNFFYSGSCLRTRNGKFYFGGTGGVNGFFPDSIRAVEYTPPVVVTGFRVNGEQRLYDRSMERLDRVEVSYLDDVLGFEFVALDYRAPVRNKYAFMMEGFNANWIEAGTRRYASYTHLDPGEYVFKVRGTNSDGVWSPVPASLTVVIVPVYWQTWWFRSLLGACVLALLWAIYRYRVGKLLELERTRSSIATDLHDDIGTGLTNIALFSDLAKRDLTAGSGGLMHRLEKISQTSRELLDSMNDIVWSIKPENDALEQTILRMEDYAVEILEENGIDLHVQIPDHLRTLALPMSVRRNLFLVFKEAIGNVLKHAGATTVDVTIAAGESPGRDRGLFLTIRDNGKGFRVGEERFGNGLQNMDTRAHALQGTVRVSSAPGEGTTVEIWFPLNSPI